ncbi:hypothetical protein QBC33DRAFT_601515 [Phialemonium atrogriseum]|uniref:NADPH--hemoprotein reductase n=1 Tax=Phialemonium atrogriseum TaxID=1093897 RepID=A0AAJ0BS78_9PEZI|nr:uncharacterized protein QBC33DRAFT_601515 [Phialemonium atrogriseum]KAK1762423.1 hypothetical protein QBC33DRAFT_601515 [Phialemonium atrogriseum]
MSRMDVSELARLAAPASMADVVALAAVGLGLATHLLRGIAWDKPDPYHGVWFERPQLRDAGAAPRQKATRNIAQRLAEFNKDIVIFWGSQSGTAEAFANRLARECHLRFGQAVLTADLSDYDVDTITLIPESKLAIFMLSTFGEGDPSDNATALWEWLRNDASEVRLQNLRYVAFGLGNSNYKHYNRVVDVVVEALDNAGARRLMPIGRADDANGGTEEAFIAWKDELHSFLVEKLGFQQRRVPYEPSFAVVEDTSLSPIDLHHGEPVSRRSGIAKARNAYSPVKSLAIQEVRHIGDSSEASCLHIELDLVEHPELRYQTGDHLAIYPINPDEEMQLIMEAVGIRARADTPLLITPLEEATKATIPSPTTALALFRHYLEICAPVSRDTIRELANFAPSQKAKDFLKSLGEDKEAYASYTAKTHVTIGRLLSLAAPNIVWKDLPLSYLVETIPPLQPRYYSVSSSSSATPRRASLTVAVDKTQLPGDPSKEIPGLTTHYLLALADSINGTTTTRQSLPSADSHRVFAHIRRSPFKLPSLASKPVIMIAAGTGIAPFRAFVQERARLRAVSGKPVGRMVLFFGCRRPDDGYLYREELARAAEDGMLEVVVAFSRSGRGMYVQDCVAEKGEESWSQFAKKRNQWLEDVWG